MGTVTLTSSPGERSAFSAKRLRDSISTPTSTESTSPETSSALSSRSGTPPLSPSFRPRLRMVTSSECSALLSPDATRDRSRPLATPRTPSRSSSAPRCRKSWSLLPRRPPSKIFPLENVLIKKVKVLKKPKFDLTKLMELYTKRTEEQKVITTEEPKNALEQ